jgi:hypothetical protein
VIDCAAIYTSLYNRAATDSAGSAVRALLGVFPTTFPTDTSFAGKKAVFSADWLSLFAGKGVTLPWLVWKEGGSRVRLVACEMRAAPGGSMPHRRAAAGRYS